MKNGGEGGIRTPEQKTEWIYSPRPLAPWIPHRGKVERTMIFLKPLGKPLFPKRKENLARSK